MARTATQGLSKHATKGFRISIGKKTDGGYRTFWLGQDRVVAEYYADTLRGQFSHMKAQGREVWGDQDEVQVKWYVEQYRKLMAGVRQRHALDVKEVQQRGEVLNVFFADSPAPAPTTAIVATLPTMPTLHAAIDDYVKAFRLKALSSAHKERTGQLLNDLKHFRADVPLAEVDRVWLQTLTDHVKTRPKSRSRKTALAPYTVRNMLRAWSRFIDWLDANGDSTRYGRWQAPRRWEELFEVRISKLMTKNERDQHADGPKQLSSEQVVRLYKAARNDVHRICILLGVFAALGQKEIATLRRDEFNLSKGLLIHRRSKTGQIGQFWLPAELTKLIRRYFRNVKSDKNGTAFFTADGELLVTDTSDAVRQAWTDIVNRVNKEDAPKIEKGEQGFYHLRKFAADYAMRKAGPVVRDTFLAHAPESVGAKHYSNSRNFNDVYAVGRTLRDELAALGLFTTVKDKR